MKQRLFLNNSKQRYESFEIKLNKAVALILLEQKKKAHHSILTSRLNYSLNDFTSSSTAVVSGFLRIEFLNELHWSPAVFIKCFQLPPST